MIKDRTPTPSGEEPWPEDENNLAKEAQSDKNGWASHAQHVKSDNTAYSQNNEETASELDALARQFSTPKGQETATWLIEELHTLSHENTRLRERYSKLQDRYRQQQQIYQEIEQDRNYWKNRYYSEQQQRRNLWRTKLKPPEKATLEEFQRQMESPRTYTDKDGSKRMCFKTAGINTGLADKTIKANFERVLDQCPDLLSLAQAEIDTREEYDPEQNRKMPRLYIKAEGSLVEAAIKSEMSQRIKQGGNRPSYFCPACLSPRVRVERKLVCEDCHHESNLEPVYPNGNLKNQNNGKNGLASHAQPESSSSTTNAQNAEKNLPSENVLDDVVITKITSDPPKSAAKLILNGEEENEVAQAAQLLLEIAGPDPAPIEMSREGEKKYYPVEPRRLLKLADLVDHLRGGRARGALCLHGELTRALVFDGDNDADWQRLYDGAFQLVEASYVPLLEQSPAGGHKPGEVGGHLWLIFDTLVNAAAAREAVLQIAPGLREIGEYWPKLGGGRVRLPGGRYARTGSHAPRQVVAWCPLVNVATGETSRDGLSSARLLLGSLTPATIVPEISPEAVVVEQESPARVSQKKPLAEPAQVGLAPAPGAKNAEAWFRERPLPVVDEAWLKKHGPLEKATFWFAVTEDRAVAWFNEHHPLESIRPRERNGMALSPNGDERTASTSYHETAQGERFTDHSAHGRRGDGTKDSGDALELASKVWNESKASLLKGAAREIVGQGSAELEAAARAGRIPLLELMELMTPAGWRQYDKLAGKRTDAAPLPSARLVQECAEPEPRATVAPVPVKPSDRVDQIKAWGKAYGWPAFEIGGQRIIAPGQSNWLSILMLAGHREEQARIYAEIQRLEAEPAISEPVAPPPVHPALSNPVVLMAAKLFNATVEIVAPDQGQS